MLRGVMITQEETSILIVFLTFQNIRTHAKKEVPKQGERSVVVLRSIGMSFKKWQGIQNLDVTRFRVYNRVPTFLHVLGYLS